MISKEEFQEMMDNHDWYYGRSEDFSLWLKGERERKELYAIAKTNQELLKMFNDKIKEINTK